ncbi:MAG TPA: hypothetical protein PKH77_23870 [Anaerolineae bacterium]|nr:hypothetical protein [Anaerolineae bacterium]
MGLRYRGYLPVFTAGRTTHLQLTERGRMNAPRLSGYITMRWPPA